MFDCHWMKTTTFHVVTFACICSAWVLLGFLALFQMRWHTSFGGRPIFLTSSEPGKITESSLGITLLWVIFLSDSLMAFQINFILSKSLPQLRNCNSNLAKRPDQVHSVSILTEVAEVLIKIVNWSSFKRHLECIPSKPKRSATKRSGCVDAGCWKLSLA